MKYFAYLSALLILEFVFVFYGIDVLTNFRKDIHILGFFWETKTPYIPAIFPVYYSVLFLPFSVVIFVKEKPDIKIWFLRMSLAIIIAGVVYLFLPSKAGYPPSSNDQFIFFKEISPTIAGHYNMLPSLHVALSIIIIQSIWLYLKNSYKFVFFLWGLLLSLSTIFTHQHHILDVLSGVLLAVVVVQLIKVEEHNEN